MWLQGSRGGAQSSVGEGFSGSGERVVELGRVGRTVL